ncbi:uncharacterized protein N0V89_003346 [Didymosphaeria variabile]|uniref:Major facilitator superfamily (MFS) profile domain-containing protein n=1 Tax=Didymosphaeria variabile TaxID=1932322 RepID=A0A9W9CF97_9PLEO|nr:uncharacterized protein N0V89_003346 [Didymosphaeria variabile]KAJ4358762.1 hypothetical protein N0V89_003346 [Didymosphaeria variabile]
MNWQLFDAFGLFLGFTANLIVSKSGDNSWRYEVASAVIPTICLLTLIWTIPESPRWFLKKGRYAEAFRSFCAIRPTPLQAAAELFYANAQLQAELQLLQRSTRGSDKKVITEARAKKRRNSEYAGETMNIEDPEKNTDDIGVTAQPGNNASYGCLSLSGRLRYFWTFLHLRDELADGELDEYQLCAKRSYFVDRIVQLFRIPRIRRATTAALIMMISQQLCGINILQFYKFIDTRGRRFLLLSSYPGMILSMLAACLAYNIENDKSRLIVVVFFMFCFIFFYSWGQGPVPFAYSSEVFPQLNREAGMSFAVFANLFGCGIIALVVPQLTLALNHTASTARETTDLKTGESRLLGIFTCLNVIALILIFFFVPETAVAITGVDDAQGLNYISLEELNYIFSATTKQHVGYQMKRMVPWAREMVKWKWKTYVLRRGARAGEKPEWPEPLFTYIQAEEFERADDGETRRE